MQPAVTHGLRNHLQFCSKLLILKECFRHTCYDVHITIRSNLSDVKPKTYGCSVYLEESYPCVPKSRIWHDSLELCGQQTHFKDVAYSFNYY